MAKGEAERNNQLIDQDRAYNQQYRAEETAYQREQRGESSRRQQDILNPLLSGYTDMSQTGGLTDEDRARMRGLYGSLGDSERNIFGQIPQYPRIGTGEGGGGGGYGGSLNLEAYKNNPNAWNELEGLYRDSITGKSTNLEALRSGKPYVEQLAKTGGYNPEFLQSIGRNMGMLDDIAVSGGVDSNSINRIRGNGVFDEYAATGGVSDYDRRNLRSRATSAIPAYYDQMRREAEQQGRVGNSSMGGAALASRNARNSARGISDATRDAELELMDRTTEGRQWGASNLSQAEGGLANLQSANRLGALGQSTTAQRGMQEYMSSMGLDAGKWLSEMEVPIQNQLTNERKFGMGGLDEITQRRIAEEKEALASRNAAASASYNAGRSAYESGQANLRQQGIDEQNWNKEMYGRGEDAYGRATDRAGLGLDVEQGMLDYYQTGRLSGLGGLGNLYGTTPGEVNMREGYLQGNRGQEADISGQNLQQRINNNPNVSTWDRVTGIIGAAAPVAGAFMGGFGQQQPRQSYRSPYQISREGTV